MTIADLKQKKKTEEQSADVRVAESKVTAGVKLETKLHDKDELVKQEDALSVYLNSLLGPGNSEEIAETEVENIFPVLNEGTPSAQIDSSSSFLDDLNDPVVDVNDIKVSRKQESTQAEPPVQRIIPEWAVGGVRCLSVTVEGLTLFIPAVFIFGILNVTNRLTASIKMPTWLYEFVDDEDNEAIQVVNTQKLIFDGVKSRRIKSNSKTYVVLLDDGAWGLSCDSVAGVMNLSSSDISWRGSNARRRWLSGTSSVKEGVILDVKKIEKALIR